MLHNWLRKLFFFSVGVRGRASVGSSCATAGKTAETDRMKIAKAEDVRRKLSDAGAPESACRGLADATELKIVPPARTNKTVRPPVKKVRTEFLK